MKGKNFVKGIGKNMTARKGKEKLSMSAGKFCTKNNGKKRRKNVLENKSVVGEGKNLKGKGKGSVHYKI